MLLSKSQLVLTAAGIAGLNLRLRFREPNMRFMFMLFIAFMIAIFEVVDSRKRKGMREMCVRSNLL